MHFLFDFDNFPIDDAADQQLPGQRGPGYARSTRTTAASTTSIDQLRNDAYGVYGNYQNFVNTLGLDTWNFGESGGPAPAAARLRLNLYQENRYIGKATLDWQADRYNRLKFGGEFTRYYHRRTTPPSWPASSSRDAYIEKPIRWNGFVEDRLDLGDVVVVGGLRYDFYDTRASRPFATDSLGEPVSVPAIHLPRMPGLSILRPGQSAAQFVRDKSHKYLSPHVQVSFPVTDRTNFRLSYSHQVQTPDFGAAPRRHQHRPQHHQHQPRVRHRSRLRQDDHLRVRHPARLQ